MALAAAPPPGGAAATAVGTGTAVPGRAEGEEDGSSALLQAAGPGVAREAKAAAAAGAAADSDDEACRARPPPSDASGLMLNDLTAPMQAPEAALDDAHGEEDALALHEEEEDEAAAAPALPEMRPLRRNRSRSLSKPVLARRLEATEAPWLQCASMQGASRETGVPAARIRGLCSARGSHAGWEFRWPAEEAPGGEHAAAAAAGEGEEAQKTPASSSSSSSSSAVAAAVALQPRTAGDEEEGVCEAASAQPAEAAVAAAESPEEGGAAEGGDEAAAAAAGSGASKRRRLDAKPVEARQEVDSVYGGPSGPGRGEWQLFPSIAQAGRETGVPHGSIAALCNTQGYHSGWRFRWPGSPEPPSQGDRFQPGSSELERLAKRIRAIQEPTERRAAVAALPEATRELLKAHLRGMQADAAMRNEGSRLRLLLGHLPDLLPAAPLEKRRDLLEGLRCFHALQCAVLAAPTMADLADLLRGATAEQRRALVETLPEETQVALQDYMLEEQRRRGAAGVTAGAGDCGCPTPPPELGAALAASPPPPPEESALLASPPSVPGGCAADDA